MIRQGLMLAPQRRTELALGWLGCLRLLLAGVLVFPGCRRVETTSHVLSVEGRVEKIVFTSDNTGEITVSYRDKDQNELLASGIVTRETEIMINGILAKLSDVRQGERIRGEVLVRRRGDKKTRTILKIYVDRATPVMPDG